jgi:hypothetical protein
MVCWSEVETLTSDVFPNIETEVQRGEAEVFANGRLIDLPHSLWDWREQGVS